MAPFYRREFQWSIAWGDGDPGSLSVDAKNGLEPKIAISTTATRKTRAKTALLVMITSLFKLHGLPPRCGKILVLPGKETCSLIEQAARPNLAGLLTKFLLSQFSSPNFTRRKAFPNVRNRTVM
jgi:hypothetical protein